MIIITWKTDDWIGGKDFLPSHWFVDEGSCDFQSHMFQNPKGRRFTARCAVNVTGRFVECDYSGQHQEYNEPYADIGILRLTFADRGRGGIPVVEWRYDRSGAEFKTYEVDISHSLADEYEQAPFDPADTRDRREKVERQVALRRGQPAFRDALLDAYERRCAISGYEIEEVLEAAHILPFNGPQTDRVQNGLLLRADIHTLFDCGLIKVTSDYAIKAPAHIREAYNLPQRLTLPCDPSMNPDPQAFALKWPSD